MKINLKLLVVFLLLLGYFFYIDDFSNIKEVMGFFHQKEFFKGIIYLFIYLLGVISIYLLILYKRTRYIILFLIFITSIIEMGYRNLSPLGFGYDDALLILQEYNSPLVKESILTYGNFFIKPFIIAFLFISFLIYFFKDIKLNNKYALVGGVLLILDFGSSYKILEISNGNRIAYPSVIKEPILLYYTATHGLYVGPREKVTMKITHKPEFKHIIYIVDESTRGDILSLNGYKINTTPYLKSIKNKLFNYGIASSGGICSSYSNAILLTGIQPNQLIDTKELARKQPLILQYAKKAGYKTSFFDMQNSREKPNNFFQHTDWQYVDYSFFIGEDYNKTVKPYEKDLIGIRKLKRYLLKHKNEYTFSYFVKQGNHFSYIDKYPKNQTIFKPILEDSGWGEWNLKIRPLFLNTYYNSIRWEVDHFFKVLNTELNNTDTIVIYTSDHAQNLIDDLNIKQTHCAKGPAPKVMAEVPFFIMPLNKKEYNSFKALYKKENNNHVSHFNIFGSILYLFGYDKKEINKEYNLTIFDDLTHQKRIFTSGDVFGRSPMYKNQF